MSGLYIIAGEPSGDVLGGHILRSFVALNKQVPVMGVGGRNMEEAGDFRSLVPLETFSHMGLGALIRNAWPLWGAIQSLKKDILRSNPEILLTIDAPELSLRLQCWARKQGLKAKRMHAVSPSVWAWRAKRKYTMARDLHHLFALFPFEPPLFTAVGLSCSMVGHPVTSMPSYDKHSYRASLPFVTPIVLTLLPGSRTHELRTLFSLFLKAARQLHQQGIPLGVVVPTLPRSQEYVQQIIQNETWPFPVHVEVNRAQQAIASGDIALASCGTVNLELARYGVPMVTAYRTDPFTALWVRRLLIQPFWACLVNRILGEALVPELLQEQCTAELMAEHVGGLLSSSQEYQRQKEGLEKVMQVLQTPFSFGEEIAQHLGHYVKNG